MATAARRARRHLAALPDDRPLRVAVYVRQSQDATAAKARREGREVEEGLGIARQEAACRAEIERRGWSVDAGNVYRDNEVSASSGKPRPGYTELMRRADRGELDVIVSWSVDRLLRRPLDMEHLITLVEQTGLRVITCQGALNLDSPEGRASARVMAVFARQEADQKGERQHLAEAQAVEQGKPPRRRAFGYDKGGMTTRPEEAAAVIDAYRMVLAGSSLAAVARMLNERELPTTLGRSWEPTAVRTLLLNARNAGIRTYYGEETGPGTWPAIVPEGTYRQAVALLRDPARLSSGGSTARKHLGASLYLCGVCAAEGVDSRMRTHYRGQGQRIYICTCARHLTRLAEPIDETVVAVIERYLSGSDLADLLAVDAPELAGLQDQAAAIRARIRRIEADYGDGEISARVMREQIDRQQRDLAGIERSMADAARSSRLAAVAGAPDPVAAWRALDVPARQGVVAALCTVTLLPGRPGRAPFDPFTLRIKWVGGQA